MKNIAWMFQEQVQRNPGATALWINGQVYSYGKLHDRVSLLAEKIKTVPIYRSPEHVAIFAYRSLTAYAGLLASLYSGRTYIPLNPRFPDARNLHLIKASEASIIIVDERCSGALRSILGELKGKTILLPEHESLPNWCSEFPDHQFYAADQLPSQQSAPEPAFVDENSGAYTLFTSGTTGLPKGVTISHKNVRSFVSSIHQLVEMRSDDRCTQHFDLTFDGSVHDLWMTWSAGAALYVVPENLALFGVRFVRENKITVWFSVPSTGVILQHHGHLKPSSMPSLRYSFFGGEALPVAFANGWMAAAPQSQLINFYGPTEATVSFLHYIYKPDELNDAEVVPIGFVHSGHRAILIDADLKPVEPGGLGELCVCGPQVATGYLNEIELTQRKFTELPGQSQGDIWYRTGDLAIWLSQHGFQYKGRVDRQIKLRGFRVELSEIESTVMKVSAAGMTAVVPIISEDSSGYTDVVAFVSGTNFDERTIIEKCKILLPDYMVPCRVFVKDALPLTTNGKIDTRSLETELKDLTLLKVLVPKDRL